MRAIKVSEINSYISKILSIDPVLNRLCVVGEISSVKYHATGHVYMTLKDENSRLNCFIPASIVSNLDLKLEAGKTIEATGCIQGYEKGGSYSLRIFTITGEKEGKLASAFDRLKEKLAKEGLFDIGHKKTLPKYPKKVAIATSDTGAAIEDIVKTVRLRNKNINLVLIPTLVQGQSAATDIVNSIRIANEEIKDVDILIVGRGGGDKEDLAAFNEEIVARAIYDSKIPIISAVGHEIDFTIADFVADLRAATPTAAAQIAVPSIAEIKLRLDTLQNELLNTISQNLEAKKFALKILADQLEVLSPANIIERGYGAILDKAGKFVKHANALCEGDEISIVMKDARLDVKVQKKTNEVLND